jgi:hypothetical protein
LAPGLLHRPEVCVGVPAECSGRVPWGSVRDAHGRELAAAHEAQRVLRGEPPALEKAAVLLWTVAKVSRPRSCALLSAPSFRRMGVSASDADLHRRGF